MTIFEFENFMNKTEEDFKAELAKGNKGKLVAMEALLKCTSDFEQQIVAERLGEIYRAS